MIKEKEKFKSNRRKNKSTEIHMIEEKEKFKNNRKSYESRVTEEKEIRVRKFI